MNTHKLFVAAVAAASFMPIGRAAVLTTYNNLAAFNAAAPGLPVMTFQPTQAQPFVLTAPLNSTHDANFFTPGSILPGISISNGLGIEPGLYVNFGALSVFNFDDSLDLTFAPAVFAFGTDLFSSEGTVSGSIAGTFVVDIYNGNTLLGQQTFNEAGGLPPSQGPFFGVTSTTPITSVNISFSGNSDGAPYINNVAFGGAASPEPDTLILAAGGVLLLLISTIMRRRARGR